MNDGNFKVRYLGNNLYYINSDKRLLTRGKIYEIKRGTLTFDDGEKTNGYLYMNLKDLLDKTGFKFELVEENKSKYNVGDIVRIRKDLEIGMVYGGDRFILSMKEYMREFVIIKEICRNGKYRIEGSCYYWTDEMIESKYKEVNRPAKKGEWVKITESEEWGDFKVGEIKKVKFLGDGFVRLGGNDGGYGFGLSDGKYVVLEKEEPEESKVDISSFTDKELLDEITKRMLGE